jgi:hypothetical protein
MRKTLGVCLLVLLLTGSAAAGDMPNDKPAPPPPPTSPAQEPTDDTTLNGVMPNDVSDILTEAALDLLAVLPSLL